MQKSEWGAERNGELPYLLIPDKTTTMVPELAVEDLPLDRTAALVSEFAVKYLPFGKHSHDAEPIGSESDSWLI